jgi:hypothetical protein
MNFLKLLQKCTSFLVIVQQSVSAAWASLCVRFSSVSYTTQNCMSFCSRPLYSFLSMGTLGAPFILSLFWSYGALRAPLLFQVTVTRDDEAYAARAVGLTVGTLLS